MLNFPELKSLNFFLAGLDEEVDGFDVFSKESSG